MHFELLRATPNKWVEMVFKDFDSFLSDHASSEKKASGMALSVAAHYPDKPKIVSAMVDLAVEELSHYRQVIHLILSRGLHPRPDSQDTYVKKLNSAIRRGPDFFLIDRLLIGGIIEKRGSERFSLVAQKFAHTEPTISHFYTTITASEERHYSLFLELALDACGNEAELFDRLKELLELEANLIEELPTRAALH